MARKFFVAFFVLVLLISSSSEAAETVKPLRIGVMRFLARTDGISADHAAAIGDIFARILTNSKTITVIERDQLDTLASEYRLSTSGMLTDETAIQIGKIAGCQYMLLGAVTEYYMRGSQTDFWVVKKTNHEARVTIDVRVVNVETTEVIMSLSEKGEASHKETYSQLPYTGIAIKNADISGVEAEAISDAASRLSYKVREALTGEYNQILEADGKEVTLSIGLTSGVQQGKLYRVYVDGKEIFDAHGKSLGKKMNDIAVVKIIDVQKEFSIAGIAGKGAGNIKLIHRGDKIYPITNEEFSSMVKRKVFPKSRPKEVKLDREMEEFLRR